MLWNKLKTTLAAVLLVAALGAGLSTIGDGSLATAQDKPGGDKRSSYFPDGSKSGRVKPNDPRPAPFMPVERPKPVEDEELKQASVDGKYSILLKKLEVKTDREEYKDFCDFGRWSGNFYAGYDNLPDGFWVYVYPNWYIWAERDAEMTADVKKASVDGKYRILLKKIEVKGDRQNYGDFSDNGYWPGTSWAGHNDLVPGYWVYVYPNWYIWAAAKPEPKRDSDAKPARKTAKEKPARRDEKKASVDGKYSRLLKVIEVPGDKDTYGEFHDYGYSSPQSYAGHDKLPGGFWVYVYPNWYIWSTVNEK